MTPHTWVSELQDYGFIGWQECWYCSQCGADGGVDFFRDLRPLKEPHIPDWLCRYDGTRDKPLSEDCFQAFDQIIQELETL